ncbi:MAG: sulfatase-like hydrolase/transferase [Lentisphaerales bacterium]|nr:sulfatase-like hydrolase/transferase [Lentisphaerales bacterium]
MSSHQSRAMVWPYDKFKKEIQSKLSAAEIHDPATITLPPYYVDTPAVRRTQARFYDCVTVMDKQVGSILRELKEDGLADDTIVFFYSDHGSGMPRHKRALLDSGMKVAMMVHVPQKWQHLVKATPGSTSNRLINFADFAPTVLSILNIDIPQYMEGQPFLGPKETTAHNYLVGHRDRVDEVIDMARSVRSQDLLYIRNFMPHLSYNQPTSWPDRGEIRHEFYKAANGKLTAPQAHFIGPTRKSEELYDCVKDPMNLNNLALQENYQGKLREMRDVLKAQVIANKDLGFLPEAMQCELSKGSTPYDMARKNYGIAAIFDAANQVGTADEKHYLQNMKSKEAAVRFWGVMGLSASSTFSTNARTALGKALSDDYINVRIQAAHTLLKNGTSANSLSVLAKALTENNMAAVMHAARTIEMLGKKTASLLSAMQEAEKRMKIIHSPGTSALVVQAGRVDMAIFVGFSIKAFLDRFKK